MRALRHVITLRSREAVPTNVSILKFYRKLRKTGSLLSIAGKHFKRKVSDENVERIREAFQRSLRKSIGQASVQLNTPPRTEHTVHYKLSWSEIKRCTITFTFQLCSRKVMPKLSEGGVGGFSSFHFLHTTKHSTPLKVSALCNIGGLLICFV